MRPCAGAWARAHACCCDLDMAREGPGRADAVLGWVSSQQHDSQRYAWQLVSRSAQPCRQPQQTPHCACCRQRPAVHSRVLVGQARRQGVASPLAGGLLAHPTAKHPKGVTWHTQSTGQVWSPAGHAEAGPSHLFMCTATAPTATANLHQAAPGSRIFDGEKWGASRPVHWQRNGTSGCSTQHRWCSTQLQAKAVKHLQQQLVEGAGIIDHGVQPVDVHSAQ